MGQTEASRKKNSASGVKRKEGKGEERWEGEGEKMDTISMRILTPTVFYLLAFILLLLVFGGLGKWVGRGEKSQGIESGRLPFVSGEQEVGRTGADTRPDHALEAHLGGVANRRK